MPWSMAVLGVGLRVSQSKAGGLRNSWSGGVMEPGRWEASGGKSAQPRRESGDKTADCRVMYAQDL